MDIVAAFIFGCLVGAGLMLYAWRKQNTQQLSVLQRIRNELERKGNRDF